MEPDRYGQVKVLATGETGRRCRVGSNNSTHIDNAESNYVKCSYVEMDETGEIRLYKETALAPR